MGKLEKTKITKLWITALALIFILVLTACSSNEKGQDSAADNTYPNAQLLVEPDWLQENLDDKNLVILDAREKGYEEGHIPGAVNLKTGEINDPKNPIEGFLLGEEGFSEAVRNVGINQDSSVVIYDDGNALSATRIFYALEYYGMMDKVKVLNGGYAGWLVAGKDVATETPDITAGNFVAKANENIQSTKDEVAASAGQDQFVLLDARSADEYSGKDVRAKKGGHIPSAVNREWTQSLQEGEDGVQRFKSYEELKKEFAAIGVVQEKTIIPYCQTNVRGSHSYFALRLLGYKDIAPYEGSWAEWGNADDVKIEL